MLRNEIHGRINGGDDGENVSHFISFLCAKLDIGGMNIAISDSAHDSKSDRYMTGISRLRFDTELTLYRERKV